MLKWLQNRPKWQRVFVFSLLTAAFVLVVLVVTLAVITSAVQSTPRTEAIAIRDDQVSVREFAVLPGTEDYPLSLAIAPDGTLYTGSYVNGTLYRITPEGDVQAIAGSSEQIASVSGLAVGADGVLYVLDRIAPLNAAGAAIFTVSPDDNITELARFEPRELLLPEDDETVNAVVDDIAVDAEGYIYLSDRDPNRVWRLQPDGSTPEIWWRSPPGERTAYAPAGLAYDPARDALLIADLEANIVYRVPLASDNPEADTEVVYRYPRSTEAPGLRGIAVREDGTLYVAALNLNRVGMIAPDTDELVYLAGQFRGASDVAYDPARERLYVTNWDQGSLLPTTFLFFLIETDPRLPFAIDVIEFTASESE